MSFIPASAYTPNQLEAIAEVTPPIHYAAYTGNLNGIESELQYNKNYIDLRNNYSDETPLHVATPQATRLLLQRGANATLLDSHGRTALDRAILTGDRNKIKVLENFATKRNLPSRVTAPRNVTDPVFRRPVALKDARILITDVQNGKIHHVYHKDNLDRLHSKRSPITRKIFYSKNVVNLHSVLTPKQREAYRIRYAKAIRKELDNVNKNIRHLSKRKGPMDNERRVLENERRSLQNTLNGLSRRSSRKRVAR